MGAEGDGSGMCGGGRSTQCVWSRAGWSGLGQVINPVGLKVIVSIQFYCVFGTFCFCVCFCLLFVFDSSNNTGAAGGGAFVLVPPVAAPEVGMVWTGNARVAGEKIHHLRFPNVRHHHRDTVGVTRPGPDGSRESPLSLSLSLHSLHAPRSHAFSAHHTPQTPHLLIVILVVKEQVHNSQGQ